MRKHVVILGGGISGMMAAGALRHWSADLDITVIEPATPGGAFRSGGFKYLHGTPELVQFLKTQQLDHQLLPIKGGILVDGVIQPYPAYLRSLSEPQARALMAAHYEKTRGTRADVPKDAMNDPWGPKPARLVVDFEALLKVCLHGVTWVKDKVTWLHPSMVEVRNKTLGFDYLINTLPLWVLGSMIDDRTLQGADPATLRSAKANTVHSFRTLTTGIRLDGYDYLYTPHTPANMIHRVSRSVGAAYDLETTRPLTQMAAVFTDIREILGEAFVVSAYSSPGHILPNPEVKAALAGFPGNWFMVGRYAAWEPRATADKVFEATQHWARAQLGR